MKVEVLRVKDLNEFKNLFKYKVLKRFEIECVIDEEKDRMWKSYLKVKKNNLENDNW